MQKLNLIHDGRSQSLYQTDDKDLLIAQFKDYAGLSAAQNAAIAERIGAELMACGIATQHLRMLSGGEMLIKKLKLIPLRLVVRNIAQGSLCQRLSLEAGDRLAFALTELFLFGGKLVNDEHCLILGLVKSENELNNLRKIGREINAILLKFFEKFNLSLVDFSAEFGVDSSGNILLASNFGARNCRLVELGQSKDAFEANSAQTAKMLCKII